MSEWSATLYDSVLNGGGYLRTITERILPTWRRSIRAVGGYWTGTCEYQGTVSELLTLYQNGITQEIREDVAGATTWQGYIAEMELTLAGVRYVRSIVDMSNAVKALYTRIGDNLLSDGGAEAGAWTAYNSATVTQSTTWVTEGTYSCSIVTTGIGTLPAGARISGAGYALTIVASAAYEIGVSINVVGGSWRISVNRSDTDASLAAASTKSVTGEQIIKLSIPATNTYAGTVDFRITAEEVGAHSAWTIYGDAAYFRLGTFSAATGWVTDANSIAAYGRRENVLLEVAMTKAQADAKVATTLKKQAWPKSLPPSEIAMLGASLDPEGSFLWSQEHNKLTLTLHGYVHTLGNKYCLTTGTGAASTLVSALITESEFVRAGKIYTNSAQYQIDTRAPIRHWQALKDIVAAGDASGNRWVGGVYADRRFDYGAADNAVAYHYQGGYFYSLAKGRLDPWVVQPGHLLYLDDVPVWEGQVSTSAEDDAHVVYISGVEMGPPTSEYPYGTLTMLHEVGD